MRLFDIHSKVSKFQKPEGGTFGRKFFRKKSPTVPKKHERDLWDISIYILSQNSEKSKGDPWGKIRKSRTMPKMPHIARYCLLRGKKNKHFLSCEEKSLTVSSDMATAVNEIQAIKKISVERMQKKLTLPYSRDNKRECKKV